jgi:hypothetical protein
MSKSDERPTREEMSMQVEGDGWKVKVTRDGISYDFGSEPSSKRNVQRGEERKPNTTAMKHQGDYRAAKAEFGQRSEDTSDWLPATNAAQHRPYAGIFALESLNHALQEHRGVSPRALVPLSPQMRDYERYCDQLLPEPELALRRFQGK